MLAAFLGVSSPHCPALSPKSAPGFFFQFEAARTFHIVPDLVCEQTGAASFNP